MRTSLPVAVAATLALGVAVAAPASAATVKPARATSTSGYDVSYPQCGSTLPTGQAFGIVGVNGGKATTANPCLGTELAWAVGSPGTATQPGAQLYVNTADPGQVRNQVTTWPSSGSTPYGGCTQGSDGYGLDDKACSWEYGYERAQNDVTNIFGSASTTSPSAYTWWLDVETSNTWETGSDAALANNRAALEGMVHYFTQVAGGHSGIYSTNSQWSSIAGTVPAGSSLFALDSWMAGARTTQGATGNCSNSPLGPGGHVALSQYVSGGLDHDLACP